MSKNKKNSFVGLAFFVIIVTLAVLTVLNWSWLVDFYRGKTYQPSFKMAEIRDSLNLTSYGEFLFNASRPELNSEEDFNENCQSLSEEDAVLGCYFARDIFVYNITEPRLSGILELTTAHELLHAVYERMSVAERDNLRIELEKVYRENPTILESEIELYASSEQLEEIYVRSGTEIKNLPEKLEKHFSQIFNDQDGIVDFYDSYIQVFRELENELNVLKSEMNDLDSEISSKTAEYERRAEQLNASIISFNSCAEVAGCFNSEYAFNVRRNQLVAEQNALDSLYDEIDHLINEYNIRVEKYNNNVIENNNLQNIINSHVKVEGV